MTNWVKQVATRKKAAQARGREERDWQLLRAQVMPTKSRKLFERLVNSLQRAVSAYNEEFSDPTLQFEFSCLDCEAIIRRMFMPDVRVTVSLNINAALIECQTAVTKTEDSLPILTANRFGFSLRTSGDLYLTDARGNEISPDMACQSILQPVMEL